MRTTALFTALVVLPVAAAPRALAQDDEQRAAERPQPVTPPYMVEVQNGLRLALARDFEGAVATLREAVQLNPSNPHAYYYIGEVQRMRQSLPEALESFRTARRMAEQANEIVWQARAMQAIAETLERQENQLTAAREAWLALASFADSHRQQVNPEIARARIQAIDVVTEQEQAYVAVRQRIEEREQERQQQGGQRNRRGR